MYTPRCCFSPECKDFFLFSSSHFSETLFSCDKLLFVKLIRIALPTSKPSPRYDDATKRNVFQQVGHNALGAGKIIAQGAFLVDIALEKRSIFNDAGWQYIKPAFENNTLHLITLLSSGGVHSR